MDLGQVPMIKGDSAGHAEKEPKRSQTITKKKRDRRGKQVSPNLGNTQSLKNNAKEKDGTHHRVGSLFCGGRGGGMTHSGGKPNLGEQ